MAKRERGPSRGLVMVGLLALHDRKFFDRLLKEPSEAVKALAAETRLELSKADMDRVVELVGKQRAALSNEVSVAMWERLHKTGPVASGIWKQEILWP